MGTVDQGSVDPAGVGLVAVVDARLHPSARGEWLPGEAVVLQLAQHIVSCDGPSQPVPREVAQQIPDGDRVSRRAIGTLDQCRNHLLHGTDQSPVPDCLEFGSPQLLVGVNSVLGDRRDALVELHLKFRRQQALEFPKGRRGAGPLGEFPHGPRAVLADEDRSRAGIPIEVPEQVAEHTPPWARRSERELVRRPSARRRRSLPLDRVVLAYAGREDRVELDAEPVLPLRLKVDLGDSPASRSSRRSTVHAAS